MSLNDSEGKLVCVSMRRKDQEEIFINKMKEGSDWNEGYAGGGESIKKRYR